MFIFLFVKFKTPFSFMIYKDYYNAAFVLISTKNILTHGPWLFSAGSLNPGPSLQCLSNILVMHKLCRGGFFCCNPFSNSSTCQDFRHCLRLCDDCFICLHTFSYKTWQDHRYLGVKSKYCASVREKTDWVP